MSWREFVLSAMTLTLIGGKGLAAEQIDIPEEELARESVLPKFDRPDNVKNRNVVTAKKIEFGLYYGSNFTEPIYNQSKIGFNLGYHWSEDSAFTANFAKWMSGRNSQYVPSIEQQGPFDFSRTPDLQYSLWGNYELNSYYGKISLTKQGVMNMSMYPIVGVGVTQYTNKMYPGVNGGVGQKFYFGKALALRIDFKMQFQQSPNPFLGDGKLLVKPGTGQTVATTSDFKDKWSFGTIMDFGLSYLF